MRGFLRCAVGGCSCLFALFARTVSVLLWRALGCPQIELLSSSRSHQELLFTLGSHGMHGEGIGGWAHRNLIPHPL
eukprot:scaffold14741_cov83-Skeletonema_marinoi.AAC.1